MQSEPAEVLTDEQRIAIFHRTSLNTEDGLELKDSEISYNLLHDKRCNPEALLFAGLTPHQLHARGVNTASRWRSLGFDALHLRDDNFCRQLIATVSSKAVVDAFIQNSGSVISIAGSEAQRLLGLDMETMLGHCVALPHAAEAVLKACMHSCSALETMRGVTLDTLMATCIGSQALKRCGIRMAHILQSMPIDTQQLSLLGYEITIGMR